VQSISRETLAKIACAVSGAMWGLFWMPLRALSDHGFDPAWSTILFYGIPFVLVLPLAIARARSIAAGGMWLQLLGFIPALSMVLYSISVLYTDVIRATLMFYIMPVWSVFMARAILKEPITAARWLAIAVAAAGMLVMFRAEEGIPLPRNIGDVVAIAAGVTWAASSTALRFDGATNILDLFPVYLIWTGAIGLAFGLLFATPAPAMTSVLAVLPWLVPALLVLVMAGVFISMWGVPQLSPATTGLLFMTEISVGALSAALFTAEAFGAREITGVLLITAAGLVETVWERFRTRAVAS
jgi:drug/metabolite transporter (DMT)-like permease